MTSVVAFVTADAAVLAADQAVWGPDGRVTSFQSKLIYVAGAGSVVAAQGIFSQALFRLVVEPAHDLADLHDRIIGFMTANVERFAEDPLWRGVTCDGRMNVWGATWWEGSPVIWGVNDRLQPGQPLEVMNLGSLFVAPDVDWSAALGRPIKTRAEVATLAPADALTIMEAQRLVTEDNLGLGPLHLAGGGCDVAIVTSAEISLQTLKLWPDQIGERIAA